MNSRSVSRIHYDSTIFFFYQIVCIGYYMSYSGSTDATEVLDMYNARYDWFSLLLKYIYRRVFKSFSSRDWSGDWYSFRVVERWRIGALAPPKFTLCTLLHNYSLLIFHEGYLIFPPLRWGLNDNQTYDIICNIISKSVLSPVPHYYALFLSSGLIFSLPRLKLSVWRWTLYLIFSHIPLLHIWPLNEDLNHNMISLLIYFAWYCYAITCRRYILKYSNSSAGDTLTSFNLAEQDSVPFSENIQAFVGPLIFRFTQLAFNSCSRCFIVRFVPLKAWMRLK